MRPFRVLQESVRREDCFTATDFIPFVDERNQIGQLKGTKRRSNSKTSRHIKIPERKISQTARPTLREKKTQFLREIYTTHDSAWNSLTKVRRLDSNFQLKIETEEEEQKQLIYLNEKLQFNEAIQRKCTTQIPTSPRLGRYKRITMIPPLGYYQPKDQMKKQPMLVFMNQMMERSKPSPMSVQQESPKQFFEAPIKQIIFQMDKGVIEKAYETERQLTDQKYRFVPKHLDLNNLEESKNKIKNMRLRIKQIKQSSAGNII